MRKITIILGFLTCLFITMPLMAQEKDSKIQTVHKVKKQETLFGITKMYGITMEELQEANPEMKAKDYSLKKGDKLNIPVHGAYTKAIDPLTQKITVGVMLPLHFDNGDGKRMLEYYRGMLMALGDLKKQGYNIDVNAWNVAEGEDIRITLLNDGAKKCNIIFGPLYTTQVPYLAEFCKSNGIKMVIPFSIKGTDVQTQPNVYQVYQTPESLTQEAILTYIETFPSVQTVIVDCADATSTKGDFTSGLRKHLDELGRPVQLTSLATPVENFQKAFSRTKRNVIILNTSRSSALSGIYAKLTAMQQQYPGIQISMFGYNEWFLYIKQFDEKMRQYDTYIPSYYNYSPLSSEIQRIENEYQQNFGAKMIQAIPRFGVTGYDQMMFWMHGLHKYGKAFNGLKSQTVDYSPIQTSFEFERINGGGFQNRKFILSHLH